MLQQPPPRWPACLVTGTKAPPISAEAASNELPFSNTSRRLTRLFESSCWAVFRSAGSLLTGLSHGEGARGRRRTRNNHIIRSADDTISYQVAATRGSGPSVVRLAEWVWIGCSGIS